MSRIILLFHCEERVDTCPELLHAIEKIDPSASIKKNWDGVIEYLESDATNSVDLVIDVVGRNGAVALEHQRELWRLRIAHNHSAAPVYFALSASDQAASLRYEIRRLGGRFMCVSDVPRHFHAELEEIQIQLREVRRSLPRWEIVAETAGADPRRAYVFLLFGGKSIQLKGSDRHQAVLAVMLKNNGIPRSMKALRELCSEDPLFAPADGPFDVPQLATLKMYIYRDFPRYLQDAFDLAISGHRAERVIEHIDLGGKPMGFRIRGIWTNTVR